MGVDSSATLLKFIKFGLQHSATLGKLAKLGNSRTPELLAKLKIEKIGTLRLSP